MDLDLEPLDPEKAEKSKEGKKATFEAEEKEGASSNYDGPERRTGEERRTGHDRREGVRFQKKEERRSGKDRRAENKGWDSFHTI